jgi:hypothetical protein
MDKTQRPAIENKQTKDAEDNDYEVNQFLTRKSSMLFAYEPVERVKPKEEPKSNKIVVKLKKIFGF